MLELKPKTIGTKNKVGRVVWAVVWFFLFRPTPRTMHAWRVWILRRFGASVGERVKVYPTAKLWVPWNLTLNDDCCIGDHVRCYNVELVVLGEHTTVSQYSYLCTAGHDYNDVEHPLMVAPITIGDKAWVTADVFIAPGVEIGEGAVVQARSVVTRDVDAWMVVGGHPAKNIKRRELPKND